MKLLITKISSELIFLVNFLVKTMNPPKITYINHEINQRIRNKKEILTHYGVYLHLDRQQQEQPHLTIIKWLLKIQIKFCDPFFRAFFLLFYDFFRYSFFSAVISNHTTLNYTEKKKPPNLLEYFLYFFASLLCFNVCEI